VRTQRDILSASHPLHVSFQCSDLITRLKTSTHNPEATPFDTTPNKRKYFPARYIEPNSLSKHITSVIGKITMWAKPPNPFSPTGGQRSNLTKQSNTLEQTKGPFYLRPPPLSAPGATPCPSLLVHLWPCRSPINVSRPPAESSQIGVWFDGARLDKSDWRRNTQLLTKWPGSCLHSQKEDQWLSYTKQILQKRRT